YAVREAVARITMNRPAVLNASNRAMKVALREAVARAESDQSVGAMVLTGAGRAFCAGGDLKETPAESAAEYRARIHLQQMLCEDLWRASKPVVAAIY